MLDPEISFHTRNKGITYFAEDIEIQDLGNGTSTVKIFFADPSSQGSVDGGHTELVILDEIGNYPEWKKVNIEVMTGIKSPFTHVSIAESRNTGTQVTAETLDELSGMHDILKNHLSNTSFGDRVSYKQNEHKEDGKNLTITLIKSFMRHSIFAIMLIKILKESTALIKVLLINIVKNMKNMEILQEMFMKK